MRGLVVAAVAAAGCLAPASESCRDGTICASGRVCAELAPLPGETQCLSPGAVAACDQLDPGAACTLDAREGTCVAASVGAVCVAQACGDRLRDRAEACDDGNQASADGCAADCLSDETCGNGIVDGVAFEQCDDGNLLDHDGCSSACRPERATWTSLEINRIGPTQSAAAAFDIARSQGVMFGGGPGFSEVSNDTWLWSGLGWTRAAPGTRPSPRQGAAMAYDAQRRRIVLFGGESAAGTFADTWEWDGATWTPRATPTSPPERASGLMTYDARRKRVVLFGGRLVPGGIGAPHYYDDTWEWDGARWTELHPAHRPERRAEAAIAYDARRGIAVVFGGLGGEPPVSTLPATVWELDGVDWRAVTPPAGPGPRTGAAMAWDPALQRVVLFGGRTSSPGAGGGPTSETWTWDGSTWLAAPVGPLPAPRDRHAMFTDPRRGAVIVAGGAAASSVPAFATAQWRTAAWSEVVLDDATVGRGGCAALDVLRGRVVIIARGDHGSALYETDGTDWRDPRPPAQRDCRALAYDPVRRHTVMLAGDATVAWDGTSWTAIAGPLPSSDRVTMVFDAARGTLVLVTSAGETWLLDGPAWRLASPGHSPPARSGPAMAYDPERREVVLFGGSADDVDLDDLWVWTGDDWLPRTPAHSPAARSDASFAWNPARRRLTLFAGLAGTAARQDMWEWTGDDWELVDTGVPPPHRSGAVMVPAPDGTGLLVIDGQPTRIDLQLHDRWVLRWDGDAPGEACVDATADQDGDGLRGCADRDCWSRCTPLCPPGSTCDAGPRCGDGTCATPLETCAMCPADCGACEPVCGNAVAEPGETLATCAGDA